MGNCRTQKTALGSLSHIIVLVKVSDFALILSAYALEMKNISTTTKRILGNTVITLGVCRQMKIGNENGPCFVVILTHFVNALENMELLTRLTALATLYVYRQSDIRYCG